jgi:hypothetical protein
LRDFDEIASCCSANNITPAGGLIFINFELARREIFQDEIKLLRKFLSCRNALRKVARRHVVKTRARFPWSCGDAVWFVSERERESAHVCFSLGRSHKTLLLLRFSKKTFSQHSVGEECDWVGALNATVASQIQLNQTSAYVVQSSISFLMRGFISAKIPMSNLSHTDQNKCILNFIKF